MISFLEMPVHTERPEYYARGFKIADVDDFERIAQGISRYVWSASAFDLGRRREISFLYADLAVFDFEDEGYSLEQALSDFCDCRHIIGTTRNHRLAKDGSPAVDRFRVVIPFETRISDLLTFRYNMHRLWQSYPMDKKCLDGARYFFPCKEIVSVSNGGWHQAVHPVPEGWGKPVTSAAVKAGFVPEKVKKALTEAWPVGDRNGTAYRVARDLAKAGFTYLEVYNLIASSPTYRAMTDRNELRKLETTIKGVLKSIKEDGVGRDEIWGRQEGSGSDGKAHAKKG